MDGATFTVLDHLTQDTPGEGVVMPFLKKFIENGVRAKLLSTPNPLTPPAWVSLMTGRTPGNHGLYDFIRAEEQGDDVYFTLYDARDVRSETIWEIASRQGMKITALNFPFTAPPPKVNGFMVPGFIPWKHLRRNLTPESLYDRLKNIPDFDPKELAWDFDREKQSLEELSDQERENWIRYHLPREGQWFRIATHLQSEEQPELMAVMFDGVDKLQHQAWRFIDPSLFSDEPDEYELRMRKLCYDYFRMLDGYIEKLVTMAGDNVQVFMASDHGFTSTTEVVRINTYLHENGYLEWKESTGSDAEQRRDASMFANLDWTRTTAYCRTPSSNGINIRVAKNEGETGIKPEDYEGFRDQLIRDLEAFVDPESGERIIAEVHKREDVFPGEAMEDAPDLLMVLRDRGFVSIKNIQPALEPRSEPAGTHHPDGIFLAGGKGIKQGVELDRRNIVDLASMMIYSLGLEIPADFEGEAPAAMFTDEQLQQQPIKIGAETKASLSSDKGDGMVEEEKDKLMAQLQMLGYME